MWNIDDVEDKTLTFSKAVELTNKYLNPKVMFTEDIIDTRGCKWTGIKMFYKIWKADQLRQQYEKDNNFEYDIVIRTRDEMEYIRNIDEEELLLADNNTIVIPEGFDYHGINDQFAFSASKAMTIYSNMFTLIEDYHYFDPEAFVLRHIKINKLDIIRIPHLYKLRGQTTETLGPSIHSREWNIPDNIILPTLEGE